MSAVAPLWLSQRLRESFGVVINDPESAEDLAERFARLERVVLLPPEARALLVEAGMTLPAAAAAAAPITAMQDELRPDSGLPEILLAARSRGIGGEGMTLREILEQSHRLSNRVIGVPAIARALEAYLGRNAGDAEKVVCLKSAEGVNDVVATDGEWDLFPEAARRSGMRRHHLEWAEKISGAYGFAIVGEETIRAGAEIELGVPIPGDTIVLCRDRRGKAAAVCRLPSLPPEKLRVLNGQLLQRFQEQYHGLPKYDVARAAYAPLFDLVTVALKRQEEGARIFSPYMFEGLRLAAELKLAGMGFQQMQSMLITVAGSAEGWMQGAAVSPLTMTCSAFAAAGIPVNMVTALLAQRMPPTSSLRFRLQRGEVVCGEDLLKFPEIGSDLGVPLRDLSRRWNERLATHLPSAELIPLASRLVDFGLSVYPHDRMKVGNGVRMLVRESPGSRPEGIRLLMDNLYRGWNAGLLQRFSASVLPSGFSACRIRP